MSRRVFNLGLLLSLCAALILTLPACSGSQMEQWDAEVLSEVQPLEPPKFKEEVTAGKLTLTATQKVRARETPIERLTILHEESYSDIDWDNVGLVVFSILGGIVSIAFWSMVAVALSGVLGRYLYLQIPRGIDGHELNRQDLERQLGESLSALPDGAALLARYSPQEEGGLFQWVIDDLKRLFKMRHFQSDLVRSGHDLAEARRLLVILRTALRLRRRIRRLEQVRALLHHWHVIHRPFAFVMYVILVIHVVVAVLFGFTWI